MVLNPHFFPEILDFAHQILTHPSHSLKLNPLYRSIGFLESLHFLESLILDEGGVAFDYKRR